MIKHDARGFRLMSYRKILITLICEWVIFSIFAFIAGTSLALPLFILSAIFGGWQLGVVTERNDWNKWFLEQSNNKKG